MNLEAQLKNLQATSGQKAKIETELREVFVQNPLLERLKGLKSQLWTAINSKIVDLRRAPQEEAQAKVSQLQVRAATLAAEIRGLDQQLGLIRETNRKIDSVRKSLEFNIAQATDGLNNAKGSVITLRTAYSSEADFAAMMGYQGFLGTIFGEALQDIETRVNERLSRLANVSHVTLHFKSEVTTGAGKVNRTITPVASVNGHETHLDAGLSGGMYTSVEGVIDLAVMAVAQERTGTLPGFLFLDESFEGQGNVTKEAALEILREYGNEKLVVVVDHSSEIKEVFTQFIDVEQNPDGTSVIAGRKLSQEEQGELATLTSLETMLHE
jgi:DNA repair exonuclease SbcCD ATPase subunit